MSMFTIQSLRFHLCLIASLLVCLLLSPRPAAADGLTVTMVSTNTTVTEGDTLALIFELTNNTLQQVTAFSPGTTSNSLVDGDDTDNITHVNINFSPTGYTPCGTVDIGQSCYFEADLQTPNDSAESDTDYGLWQVPIAVDAFGVEGNNLLIGSDSLDVKVVDPGYLTSPPSPPSSSVPESPTALLLAVGLAGLALVKFRHWAPVSPKEGCHTRC